VIADVVHRLHDRRPVVVAFEAQVPPRKGTRRRDS
jgi:hypothetical protein